MGSNIGNQSNQSKEKKTNKYYKSKSSLRANLRGKNSRKTNQFQFQKRISTTATQNKF